jgi:NADPH:quinone reductase-like Zn-dependent oxidoreductase
MRGPLAEYAVVPAAAVSAKPARAGLRDRRRAALAGAAATTAVDAVDPQPRQTVPAGRAGSIF